MKFGLVKGSGFSPWEAPLHEAVKKYGFDGVGICSNSNQFIFKGIKMPLRKLKSPEIFFRIPILGRLVQWIFPVKEYLIGFRNAVSDLDLLHTTETFNIYSKQCVDSGKPTVISVCDNIPYNRRAKLDRIDAYVKKRAKQFVVTTELGSKMLELEGIEKSKISIIPHAIDTGLFKPMKKDENLLRKYGIKKGCKIILFIGELEETKGIQYLLFALKALLKEDSNIVLLIAGKGSLKDYLMKLIERMNLERNVIFLGYHPYTEMPKIHNLADALCLPSSIVPRNFFRQAWNEKFGYVLIEAMACGKPVVSTTSGGIPYVVQNGKTGVLVPSGNWVALAKELSHVLYDRRFAESLSKNARKEAIERYDIDVVAKDLAKVYEKALK